MKNPPKSGFSGIGLFHPRAVFGAFDSRVLRRLFSGKKTASCENPLQEVCVCVCVVGASYAK